MYFKPIYTFIHIIEQWQLYNSTLIHRLYFLLNISIKKNKYIKVKKLCFCIESLMIFQVRPWFTGKVYVCLSLSIDKVEIKWLSNKAMKNVTVSFSFSFLDNPEWQFWWTISIFDIALGSSIHTNQAFVYCYWTIFLHR